MPAMEGRVFEVQFNHDGSRLAAVSSNHRSGKLSIYQPDEGKEISTLAIPTGGLFAVSFSQDGSQVAAGGADGKLLIVDAASGSILQSIELAQIVQAASPPSKDAATN